MQMITLYGIPNCDTVKRARSKFISRERSADYYYADRSDYSSRLAKADVSIVGADGTVYLVEQLNDAVISEYKSVSRFPGFATR